MLLKKNLIISLLIFISAFTGCSSLAPDTKENTQSPVIIGAGCDCNIVYSKSSSDYVVRQAKSLEVQIEDSCSSFVTLNSDWTSSSADDTVEILFGNTTRPESIKAYSELPENGYIIREENGKIIIAATSEKLLKVASIRFMSDYVSINTGIAVPKNTNVVESDFTFFNIACDGKANSDIIIPDNASPAIQKLANFAAYQINKKCNSDVKVMKIGEAHNIRGAILVSTNDKYLSQNESSISYVSNRLDIKGANEFSTINALSLFIDHIVHSCDKKEDGVYHIYFPTDEVIESEWDYSVPVFAGGILNKAERISGDSYVLYFDGALENDYRNYLDILKILGFIPTSSSEKDGNYSCSLKNDKTDVLVSFSEKSGNVSIFVKGAVFTS